MNATRTRRRPLSATVVALLAVPALSACGGTGFDAQTDQVYLPADGVMDRSGDVDVLNALIVTANDGSGRVIAGLVNNTGEPEELTGVVGAGEDDGVTYTFREGQTVVPAEGLLDLSDDEAVEIVVEGDEERVAAGKFLRLTFQFETADDITLNVPLLAPGEDYADVELPVDETTGTPQDAETSEDGGISEDSGSSEDEGLSEDTEAPDTTEE